LSHLNYDDNDVSAYYDMFISNRSQRSRQFFPILDNKTHGLRTTVLQSKLLGGPESSIDF